MGKNLIQKIHKPQPALSLFSIFTLLIFLAGCSSQVLVPIGGEGYTDSKTRSMTKSLDGVEITVLPSIWEANPYYLKDYITPVYVEIKNNNVREISFDYKDAALITASDVQYNPLSPGNAAGIISSSGNRRPAFSISVSSGFGYSRYHRYGSIGFHNHFHPFHHRFHDPFYDPYYYHEYYPAREINTSDIYSKAITSGSIRPGATLNGFLYFTKLPDDVGIVNLQIIYSPDGEEKKFQMEFPFAVLLSRN